MNKKCLRVAIIGAGPAGLYAAGQLFDQQDVAVEVDVFDRLPTPHGLVRAGVAPDHPDKKLVIDNMFDHYLAHPNLRFFGNIEVGKDISHNDIATWYDAVIYSVGASNDVKMNIPGEDLPGSWAAREFVAWYNGHPDYSHLEFDFSSKRAVIIGNGNVALDVARILTLPKSELEKTDIADHAIAALSKGNIEEVVILARRSHYQAAFNNPEIEEFEHLDGIDVVVEGDQLDEKLQAILNSSDWQSKRKVDTLNRLKQAATGKAAKRVVFKFLTAPVEVIGTDKVSQLKVTHNVLQGESLNELKPVATDEQSLIDTGLVLRSIGYRGKAIEGLPFDEAKGVIPNDDGRVVGEQSTLTGVYVTGWIKRGPRGVIGSNKKCARDTVRSLLSDYQHNNFDGSALKANEVLARLVEAQPALVTTQAWKKIDHIERLLGREQHRPRVKQTQWQSLLSTAGVQTSAEAAGE
jgi:ferredoxin--NADP+ reductase